jgi:hypothetical protein
VEDTMRSVIDTNTRGILTVFMMAGATLVLAQSATTTTGPAVKPAAVQKKAAAPTPPANATKATSVGKTAIKHSTANSPTDDDSFWIESTDIDGDGNVEDANYVWDDEDKVLFAYADGTFTCGNGGTGAGELLVAVVSAGNTWNRPAGSGFWVAAVDKSECGAQAAGLVGCKFNAAGSATACGVATLDEKTDDLVIVAAAK